MKVKYLGPRDGVHVEPYGVHLKNQVKDYPGDFAENLIATSQKQRFKAVEARKSAADPEKKASGNEKKGKK